MYLILSKIRGMVRQFRNQVETMKVGISVVVKNINECGSIRKELDSMCILKNDRTHISSN